MIGLTQRQAVLVAAIGTFVTVLGAVILAAWFRRQNMRRNELCLA